MSQNIEGYLYEGDFRKSTSYGRYRYSGIRVESWAPYRRIFERGDIPFSQINGGEVRNMRITPLVRKTA